MSKKEQSILLEGVEACAEGALYAGVNFFAGYPITPSSEVAGIFSLKLPRVENGVFIQMEDEGSAISTCIGASLAGRKVITATSGPGISIMQEQIGYACMTEAPCVIVNVQRGGPSTGLPTQVAQADIMQARWGTHGDHALIALAPSTVEETFYITLRAVNLAEKYRVPVIILMDEVLAHSKENMVLPAKGECDVVERKFADPADKDFKPFDKKHGLVPPMIEYGSGLRGLSTGLTHNEKGIFTTDSEEVTNQLNRLNDKIYNNLDDIIEVDEYMTDDADILMISLGTSARSCGSAVNILREKGVKVGLLNLVTVWPFPDDIVKKACDKAKDVFVVEMNMGQIVGEVQRISETPKEIKQINKYDGYIITPKDIVSAIEGGA